MGKDRGWPGRPFISWTENPVGYPVKEPKPSSLHGIKHLAEKSPETVDKTKKFFYKSSHSMPLKFSPGAEQALRECEEHATWANAFLKTHRCRLIGDLKKSLGDGLTLINLVQSIVEDKVPGVQNRPIIRAQKVENIERCLRYLDAKGVDTSELRAEAIIEGDLKTTLALMENLRKRYDPDYFSGVLTDVHRPTPVYLNNDKKHSHTPSMPSHPFYSNKEHDRRGGVGREIIPGIMTDQEEIFITSAPNPIMSTTEFDARGVSQHGANEKRQLQLADVSYKAPKSKYKATRNGHHETANGHTETPTFGHYNQHQPKREPCTVEERLKNLLNSPPVGVASNHQNYGEGELLLPPVPAKRPIPVSRKFDRHTYDNPALDVELELHDYRSERDNLPSSSYVPSRPAEKREGARGETLLETKPQRTPIQTPEVPHREWNGPMREDPPRTVNGHADGQSQDLRDMCNKMYSKEKKTGQPLNVKTVAPPPYDMAMRNRNPFYQRPDPSGHSSPHGSLSSGHTVSSSQGSEHNQKIKIAEIHMVQMKGGVKSHDPPHMEDMQMSDSEIRGHVSGQSSRHDSHSSNQSGLTPNVSKTSINPSTVINEKDTYLKQQKDQIKRDQEVEKKRLKTMELRRKSITEEENKRQMTGPEKVHNEHARHYKEPEKPVNRGPAPFMGRRASSPGKMPTFRLSDMDTLTLSEEDSIFMAEDLECDNNSQGRDYESDVSSRSVTPPLPPLSPLNTPPLTPPDSPTIPKKYKRSMSACALLGPRPDLLKQTLEQQVPKPAPRSETKKKKTKTISTHGVANSQGKSTRNSSANKKASRGASRSQMSASSSLPDVQEDHTETEDGDAIQSTSQDWSQGSHSSNNQKKDVLPSPDVAALRNQLSGLESMYSEILRIVDQKSGKDRSEHSRHDSRRNSIAGSVVSQNSSYYGRSKKVRRSNSLKQRHKELKHVNKRFARLESHVVTLARSVAHLSSEMRSQNTLYAELDTIRQELQELRDSPHLRTPKDVPFNQEEFERFRGWVPTLINPKRVNKLTKFFGQEPPLLQLFLKRLGYERYTPNFEREHVGMNELPYMNEERLKTLGIPMGPRLRILQESQMCFRQENFNIYIV